MCPVIADKTVMTEFSLDELLKQYIYMKVCYNTTPENSLKYFDLITDI